MNTIAVKESNPKDAVGIRKWRYLSTVPITVLWEIGAALLEGALKYGRHNYRVSGVRGSVYVDAAIGHIGQWWEGEDIDADSGLSHITKAIASLVVVRDAMIQNMLVDDRPPRGNLDAVRGNLQTVVNQMLDKYPEPKAAMTQIDNGVLHTAELHTAEGMYKSCPDCDGKGRWSFQLGGDSCDRCHGSGLVLA